MNKELLGYIENHNYNLTYEDILLGIPTALHNLGLNDVLVCFEGRGRGPRVSELLCRYDHPAIALEKGAEGLENSFFDDRLASGLAVIPRVIFLLDWAERKIYKNKQNIDIYKYFDDPLVALDVIRHY